MNTFDVRGVVEGYYGPPYADVDREWLVERMGEWGMNTYVYAPKSDDLGRENWRTPYSDEALTRFETLVAHGNRHGVSVGFAISPGLSLEYSSDIDLDALIGKFRAFADIGARFFSLALDDIPSELSHPSDQRRFGSLAGAQVAATHAVRDALSDEATLWLVPTDYAGVGASPYLEELARNLDPAIELGWTGRTVVSPTIPASEAAARAEIAGRRLLLWDNIPVADGPMRPMLHLAPYTGRDPDLAEHVSGVLLNPMEHPRASAVALRTAASYLAAPQAYDPERAWLEAVEEIGAGAPRAFAVFAAAHRFSAQTPRQRDSELESAFREFRALDRDAPESNQSLERLHALSLARRSASDEVRENLEDSRLARELEPWLQAHRTRSEQIAAALDLLTALEANGDPAASGARTGSAAGELARVLAFFRFEGRLTRLPPPTEASYGPTRVVYPQLVDLSGDSARFGDDPVLFENLNLADEIVRFAETRASERLSGFTRAAPIP